MNVNGYAKYIFVEAKDNVGKSLGKSTIIETFPSNNISAVAVAQELLWLRGGSGIPTRINGLFTNPIMTFLAGAICGGAALFAFRRSLQWWQSQEGPAYERVATGDATEVDEWKLDDISASRSYPDEADDSSQETAKEEEDANDRF